MQASIIKAYSLAEMTQKSSLILEGQIIRIHSEWTPDRRTVVSYIDILHMPQQVIKDDPMRNAAVKRVGNIVTVKLQGGTFDYVTPKGKVTKRALVVVGNPSFELNERVLIFLRPGRGRLFGGFFTIVGMAQGKYWLENNVAKRALNGLGFIGDEPERQLNELPLVELRAMILQEVNKQRQVKEPPQKKQ